MIWTRSPFFYPVMTFLAYTESDSIQISISQEFYVDVISILDLRLVSVDLDWAVL